MHGIVHHVVLHCIELQSDDTYMVQVVIFHCIEAPTPEPPRQAV